MNKIQLAGEIFEMLSLYPKIAVEKSKFVSDMHKLSDDTLLFIYQGMVEIEEFTHHDKCNKPKSTTPT